LEKYMAYKICFPLMIVVLLAGACIPVQKDPGVSALPASSEVASSIPNIPVTGGDSTTPGDVEIDSLAIQASDSFPAQYALQVKGSMPSSCHQLRTGVVMPAMRSEIHVQVYSVYDPYTVCAQVAKPFEASIPLGSYVRGSYIVFVNEKEVGEITP
jgi:hypothetical protein